MNIKNILFDADGVLQYPTRDWQPALQIVLGLNGESQARSVLDDIFEAETEALTSTTGFAALLELRLAKWGCAQFLPETLDILHAIEVHADIMQVVQAIRCSGIGCHIASNQQALRAKHMSEALNYGSLFDGEFYSCFVGAAKPRAAFFERVVAKLGCDAGDLLFVDDRPENVEAAQQAGLKAMVFLGSAGAPSLRSQLQKFGVFID